MFAVRMNRDFHFGVCGKFQRKNKRQNLTKHIFRAVKVNMFNNILKVFTELDELNESFCFLKAEIKS